MNLFYKRKRFSLLDWNCSFYSSSTSPKHLGTENMQIKPTKINLYKGKMQAMLKRIT